VWCLVKAQGLYLFTLFLGPYLVLVTSLLLPSKAMKSVTAEGTGETNV
jgi:hypothetical protein